MGNKHSNYKRAQTEPILQNIEAQQEISALRFEITRLYQTIDGFDRRFLANEKRINELSTQLTELKKMIIVGDDRVENTINEKITVLSKDMESLLNNEKLLLEKMIEKHIVSTIQEENDSHITQHTCNESDNETVDMDN